LQVRVRLGRLAEQQERATLGKVILPGVQEHLGPSRLEVEHLAEPFPGRPQVSLGKVGRPVRSVAARLCQSPVSRGSMQGDFVRGNRVRAGVTRRRVSTRPTEGRYGRDGEYTDEKRTG